jgi:hypothetical protein
VHLSCDAVNIEIHSDGSYFGSKKFKEAMVASGGDCVWRLESGGRLFVGESGRNLVSAAVKIAFTFNLIYNDRL